MPTPLITQFDPSNESHVLWLKEMFDVIKIMNTDDIVEAEKNMQKLDLEGMLGKNPMKLKVSKDELLQFPIIHFTLSVKYSEAVLDKKAWLPS